MNGVQILNEERAKQPLGIPDLMHGKYIVIKVGKKSFALVEID